MCITSYFVIAMFQSRVAGLPKPLLLTNDFEEQPAAPRPFGVAASEDLRSEH